MALISMVGLNFVMFELALFSFVCRKVESEKGIAKERDMTSK